jgi:triphosphatase
MSTEIELKFLVLIDDELCDEKLSTNITKNITALLQDKQLSFKPEIKKLANCYFDTPEQSLRKLNFGLRIRQDNEHIEQTIKTDGEVVGGLHQRPEYNVELANSSPELSLFPVEIWPDAKLVKKLQPRLIDLFNTDFTRHIWRVNFHKTIIDIAFDQGEINSSGQSLPICELELEIVNGDISDLFNLASLLFNTIKLRPGVETKAQRGYQIYSKLNQQYNHIDFEIINYPDKLKSSQISSELSDGFVFGIGVYLQQLQQSVERYMRLTSFESLANIVKALKLLHHGFWLFESQLSQRCDQVREDISHFIQLFSWLENAIYLQELMNKTGNYRKKLDYSKELIYQLKLQEKRFPDKEMIIELLHSERFNLLQMNLVQMAIKNQKVTFFVQQKSNDLTVFAQQKLSACLTTLTNAIPKQTINNAEQVLAIRQSLQRSLLTGYWFGSLFDKERRQQFRTPWLDIEQGLIELQSLWIIEQQLEKLVEPAEKIVKWQHGKVDNLLIALEHSKKMALSMKAYWHS